MSPSTIADHINSIEMIAKQEKAVENLKRQYGVVDRAKL
jgi:hypothetical protein